MTKQQWTGVSIIILAVVIGVGGYLAFSNQGVPIKYWFSDPATFQDCTLAGGLILEMYPEQCRYRGKSFTNPDQKLNTTPNTPPETSQFPDLNTQDNTNTLTYTNTDYNFKLSLPKEYGAYSTQKRINQGPAKNATQITFYVDSRNTNGDDTFGVFVLFAYPRAWWDKNATVDNIGGSFLTDPNAGLEGYLGNYINKNNSYVFTSTKGQDCPTAIGTNSYDTVQCRLYENVDSVTKTFQFIQ